MKINIFAKIYSREPTQIIWIYTFEMLKQSWVIDKQYAIYLERISIIILIYYHQIINMLKKRFIKIPTHLNKH
jgi:hypothetical protein